jgi:hypothetical protein
MDRRQLQQAVSEAQASIQMQAQQQLSERMHSICFKRCITAPTDKLADRQRRCLDQCLGAFQEGFGVAVRAGGMRRGLGWGGEGRLRSWAWTRGAGRPLLQRTHAAHTQHTSHCSARLRRFLALSSARPQRAAASEARARALPT